MPFTVAIIGRPNVGKSTLFNRLVGRRLALVDDTPGLTRDRREGEGRIADLRFTAVDTAGLEDAALGSLEGRMRAQTERAVAAADVALLLIDARAGVTPLDRHFAALLRRGPTPVVVVANKCEGGAGAAGLIEAYELGLGDPLAVSAEHGEGLDDLYQALRPFAGADGAEAPGADEATPARPLKLAIVGRPNVGKSTLVNRLLGEERMLTGPEPGITRDAVPVRWRSGGREIELVDTAGLRRKARVTQRLEGLAVGSALRAIRFAEVVVVVVDAAVGIDRQDLVIASLIVEEGRAPVVALNKWDLVEDRATALRAVRERLEESLPQARGIAVVALSAVTGAGVDKLLPAVRRAEETWNRRVATAELNRWLAQALDEHPPPLASGRRVRIRYATQVKARPPTFALFTSRPEKLSESYLRYLANGLRKAFGLGGVPLRLHSRKGSNPYAPDRRGR